MTDAQRIDAIEKLLEANEWTITTRRQLARAWSIPDVQMADLEGRARRAIGLETTSPADKERMRWTIWAELEEARKLALYPRGPKEGKIAPGAAVSASLGKAALFGLIIAKVDTKADGGELKTLAEKRRVAKEARGALVALEQDIAAEEAGRH